MVYTSSNCGKVYFGPSQVKHFRKTVKKWICLFTCFSTRVVHLKIVSSLDTQSCLDTLHRFVARQGCPKTILSGNGTKFVGAAREFCELFSALNGNSLEKNSSKLGRKWTFNTPDAPHSGGVRERLVRSCKKAIWSVLSFQSVKHEQLTTVVCSAKQLINNRPLTPSSSDAADLEALTPNHFILGTSTIDYPNVVINGGSAAMKNAFWAHSQFMK